MSENLFCPGQATLTKTGRDNYDKIRWDGKESTSDSTVQGSKQILEGNRRGKMPKVPKRVV
jgi:hypothetical protein